MPAQPAAVHQSLYEVLTNESPQEVGDSSRAVEMPVLAADGIYQPAFSVGRISRSGEQDSLQQNSLHETQPGSTGI